MAIYKGLNVSLYLGDVDNLTNSLENLGLRLADLERIRGLGTSITTSELHLLSGLDIDQEKETYSLFRSANVLDNTLLSIQDISRPLDYNIRIDNQLRAGAIKYNFLQYDDPATAPYVDQKSADISTSRVSSWSKIGNGPVFYGANLEINPTDGASYGDPLKSIIKIEDLIVQGDISAKRFDAEETTDLVTININGVNKNMYAMRSIPTSFYGFFRKATVKYDVVPGVSNANPTVLFADLSTDPPIEIPITGLNSSDTITFDVTRSVDRRIDLYYRPDGIQLFDLQNIKMREFPNAIMKNLQSINLAFNDLVDLPDFYNIAGGNISGHTPVLRTITMTANGLDRSPDTANTQLHNIPSSVTELNINGCFSDSETIDIGTLPSADGQPDATSSLQVFRMDSYYDEYNARQMTDNNVTPEVADNNIRTYSVRRQPYRTIAHSVVQSTSLQTLDLYNCNISSAATSRGTRTGATSSITLNSPVISSIEMGNNAARVFDVRNKANLVTYNHYRNWSGASNNIDGFFQGCTSLRQLYLYHSYVQGTLNTAFANLPSLQSLHLYNTRLGGNMHATTLAGNTSLRYLNVSHGVYDTTANDANNFFGNAVVDELNEEPENVGSQYGGGYYAGLMENSATDTPYSDAYPRPANEDYYLIVSDAEDEIVGAAATVRNHCDNLNSGGFTDWDMPTQNELELMYRNLKPDTTPNDTNHPGSNPDSVPSFNRDYTSNSPGRTNLSIFQAGGSQAFTIPSNQNYATGSTIGVGGWQTYNGASASNNGNRIVVEQGFLGSNGGIYKILSDLPDGMYIATVRVRYEGGNGNGDDLEISARTNSEGGGLSRGGITVTNLDDNSPSDVSFEIEKRSGETLNLTFECEDLDFSIENWSVVSKGAFYWSAEAGSGTTGIQNMQDGEQDSPGGSGVYRVRPIRRVPVKTGVQIEQQGTSNTFQPVGPSLFYFFLRYNRGIRGKLPNIGFLNQMRDMRIQNTGIVGELPDISFMTKLYRLWILYNYFEGTLNLENPRLSDVRGYGNRFTSIGSIDIPNAWIFHFSNNLFTGDLPDFSKCTNMYDIYLHNNSFSNYISGSLASNSRLRRYYVYNNNLTLQDAQRILVDLKASYDLRNRSNCTVNMTGNVLISEAELVTFPEYFEILTFLRSKGWTILLNP